MTTTNDRIPPEGERSLLSKACHLLKRIDASADTPSASNALAGIDELLDPLLDESFQPENTLLKAQASITKGLAHLHGAIQEREEETRTVRVAAAATQLQQGMDHLLSGFPGDAVMLMPSVINGLAAAIPLVATKDQESMADQYARALAQFIMVLDQTLAKREQGLSLLAQSASLQSIAGDMSLPRDTYALLEKAMSLNRQAMHLFSAVLDETLLSRAAEERFILIAEILKTRDALKIEKPSS